MAYSNKLLIDGTNVEDFPGVFAVELIDGLRAPGDRRGDDDPIPGANGELGARLPYAKYLITVPLWVAGTSVADLNSNLNAIDTACRSGGFGLVQLARHLDNGAGHDTHTARGRFATGMNFQSANHTQGKLTLQFYNLSGAWWNGTDWVL